MGNHLEPLEHRTLLAVSAVFIAPLGLLRIRGDNAPNSITVDRDPAGNLRINDGAIRIFGGKPTSTNTSSILILGSGGADHLRLDEANGILPPSIMFGESGSDTLIGGSRADLLHGGAGDDSILGHDGPDSLHGDAGADHIGGNGGDDIAFLGSGSDLFTWDAGDGSDIIEGGSGADRLTVTTSDDRETLVISASGARAQLSSLFAGLTIDMDDLEAINLRPAGEQDTIEIQDLSSTDLADIHVDLSDGLGDFVGEMVIVRGSSAADVVEVAGDISKILVHGLGTTVTVSGSDLLNVLTVDGAAGDDIIDASELFPDVITMGIVGGDGSDILIGTAGRDFISGGPGNDILHLGDGDDESIWNNNDGNDIVQGGGGFDQFNFTTGGDANFDLSTDGNRFRFFRDTDNVLIYATGMEFVELLAFNGVSSFTINDLSQTDVTKVLIYLGGIPDNNGTGDGLADSIIINGTSGDDVIEVSGSGQSYSVTGLSAEILVRPAEIAHDLLTINGLAGNDLISAADLQSGVTQLLIDGGDGADTVIGSAAL